ncbi:chitotriosidase-1-like isoform X2 [Paramacrobiotus metropolitanus]|uniref:chitotriosidase-1-like isoform X2 n=1 Tax=Paramacrobiotus metropolitanus TaxID=2943436 RepID=UPI0024460A81|nr:chitotriosidase-1-like isoform X2 [Paramacrobiotus metropolitanus]
MLTKIFLIVLILVEIFTTTVAINDPHFDLPHRGCYFTNWSQYRKGKAKFTAADIDPDLCTYIVIAFAKIENNTLVPLEWNDEETFRRLNQYKLTHPNLKILLSVGGWTLSNQLVAVSETFETRHAFITSTVVSLRNWELDGLDVDWEYPDAATKEEYSSLLLELREAFEKEAKRSKKTRLILAAAVHFTSDGGYDGRIMNQALDFLNVMAYDLHGAWIPDKIGHHAPLFKGPFAEESPQSVAATMKSWELLGIPKHKLILGLPMYGRGWLMASPLAYSLGSPAKGAISTSKFTSEAGAWPYYEICDKFKTDNASYVFDKQIQAAYAFTKDYWIGFDDRLTVAAKTKWAKTNGYGGVYIWDLAQDDFHNICGLGINPLLHVIRDILTNTRTSNDFPIMASPGTTKFRPTTLRMTTQTTTRSTPTTIIPETTTPATVMPRRVAHEHLVTKPRVTFSMVLGNSQPVIPRIALEKQICDKNFCIWSGPGSFAVGRCESRYCDCDAGSNPYSRECNGGLVYDAANKYCNWQELVEGCTRFNGESPEAIYENKFLTT